jgi:Protein of unknown function (DUF2950)
MRDTAMMTKILRMAVVLGCTAIPLSSAWAQTPAPKAAASAPAAQRTFSSPDEAAKALAAAVRAADVNGLVAVVGPASKSWLFSGDGVADREDWKNFLAAYDRKNALTRDGDAKATLVVGEDDWPFPAPLVKKGNKWAFDHAAGREEVINRRVGRNELDTIQTLLAIVDAQREYAATDPDRNGIANYAQYFISSPGKKNGLYWETKPGEAQSPLGPLVGEASAKGYAKGTQGKPQPYNGYYYRLIFAQGKNAPGGAYDYRVKGRLFGGFAVVAYPATYGVSGVKTFIVNHNGVVHEKDLGAATASLASAMTQYNPDRTWEKAE